LPDGSRELALSFGVTGRSSGRGMRVTPARGCPACHLVRRLRRPPRV